MFQTIFEKAKVTCGYLIIKIRQFMSGSNESPVCHTVSIKASCLARFFPIISPSEQQHQHHESRRQLHVPSTGHVPHHISHTGKSHFIINPSSAEATFFLSSPPPPPPPPPLRAAAAAPWVSHHISHTGKSHFIINPSNAEATFFLSSPPQSSISIMRAAVSFLFLALAMCLTISLTLHH